MRWRYTCYQVFQGEVVGTQVRSYPRTVHRLQAL